MIIPGGSIEESEKVLDCLKREIHEEVNGTLLRSDFLRFNEYQCEYMGSDGTRKKSHHVGLYYHVNLSIEKLRVDADGHDSLSAEWIETKSIEMIEVALIAKEMILKCL